MYIPLAHDIDDVRHQLHHRDRTAAHRAGHIVAGVYFGRLPTTIDVEPLLDDTRVPGVEFEPSFAQHLLGTAAPFAHPGDRILFERAAREDAAIALAGRPAEIALGLSSKDAEVVLFDSSEPEALALKRAFGADAVEAEVTAAERRMERLFERDDALVLLYAAFEELRRKAWQSESMDPRQFVYLLQRLLLFSDLFAAGAHCMRSSSAR